MFESSIFNNQDRGTPEERLWRAVIAKTLEEWACGSLRYSRKAEEFLFHDNRDFLAVCCSAGMDPDNLRKKLHSIRARGLRKVSGKLLLGEPKKLNPRVRDVLTDRAYGI